MIRCLIICEAPDRKRVLDLNGSTASNARAVIR